MPLESPVNPQDEKSLAENKAMARGLLNQWSKSSPISEKPIQLPKNSESEEIDVNKIIDRRLETTEQRKKRELKEQAAALKPIADKELSQWDNSKPASELFIPTEEELTLTDPTSESAMKLNVRSAAPDEWETAQELIERDLETPEARQERAQKQQTDQLAKEKQEKINLEKLENMYGEKFFRNLIQFDVVPPALPPKKDRKGKELPPEKYEDLDKTKKFAFTAEYTAGQLVVETLQMFPDKAEFPTSILMGAYVNILRDQGEVSDNIEEMARTLEEYAVKNKLQAVKEQAIVTPSVTDTKPAMSPQERRTAAIKRAEEMREAAAQTAAALNGEDSKRTMAG